MNLLQLPLLNVMEWTLMDAILRLVACMLLLLYVVVMMEVSIYLYIFVNKDMGKKTLN